MEFPSQNDVWQVTCFTFLRFLSIYCIENPNPWNTLIRSQNIFLAWGSPWSAIICTCIFIQFYISFSGDILISSFQCSKLTNESKDILGGAGELAQARSVKLINVRAKVSYFSGNVNLSLSTEAVQNKKSKVLKFRLNNLFVSLISKI